MQGSSFMKKNSINSVQSSLKSYPSWVNMYLIFIQFTGKYKIYKKHLLKNYLLLYVHSNCIFPRVFVKHIYSFPRSLEQSLGIFVFGVVKFLISSLNQIFPPPFTSAIIPPPPSHSPKDICLIVYIYTIKHSLQL